jgi:hypothetical protein
MNGNVKWINKIVFLVSLHHYYDIIHFTIMEFTFKFWSNCAIVYGFLIIIINGVKIHYVEHNPIPEYNPVTKTGCVIHDLQHVTNYSAAYIGLSFAIVLLLMCMQNIKHGEPCGFDDAACGGMPVCLALMSYLGMFIASCNEFQKGELEYDNSSTFKKISEFVSTGCDKTVMNVIYSGLFITTLPMLLFGAVVGCVVVGCVLYGIGYGIGYVFWKWLCSCYDFEANCKKKQNEQTNNINYTWQYECPVIITHTNITNNKEHAINNNMKRSVSYTSIAPSYVSLPPTYDEVAANSQPSTSCNIDMDTKSINAVSEI